MPAYDKHLIGGLAIFIPLACLFKTNDTTSSIYIQWLFFTLLGSLFPDIDTKSHIQKWIYSFAFFTICMLYLTKNKINFIWTTLFTIPILVKHRGIFHNPRFLLILSFGLIILFQINGLKIYHHYWIFALFFLAGTYSHLILDIGCKRFLLKLLK